MNQCGMKRLAGFLIVAFFVGCRTNESPKQQANDIQITAQVKAKLVKGIGLDSVTNISVNSTDGVVTLSGMVDSPELKVKAESIARSVPKVVRVVSVLQVTPKPERGKAGGRGSSPFSGSRSNTA